MSLARFILTVALAWIILQSVASLPVRSSSKSDGQRSYVNSELSWHQAVLDSQGKLLTWYHPERNQGYDKVLHLA